MSRPSAWSLRSTAVEDPPITLAGNPAYPRVTTRDEHTLYDSPAEVDGIRRPDTHCTVRVVRGVLVGNTHSAQP
eukprot:45596-Eustigmatos_ZCMA.PRE.1